MAELEANKKMAELEANKAIKLKELEKKLVVDSALIIAGGALIGTFIASTWKAGAELTNFTLFSQTNDPVQKEIIAESMGKKVHQVELELLKGRLLATKKMQIIGFIGLPIGLLAWAVFYGRKPTPVSLDTWNEKVMVAEPHPAAKDSTHLPFTKDPSPPIAKATIAKSVNVPK